MVEDPLDVRWRSTASRLRADGVQDPVALFREFAGGMDADEASAGELDAFDEWVAAGRPARMRRQPRPRLQVDLSPNHPLGDAWCSVSGESLDQPVDVKIGRVGSALHVIGLHIDNGLKVSASTLRTVRTGEIEKQVRAELAAQFPAEPATDGVKFKYRADVWHDLVWEWGRVQDFAARVADAEPNDLRATRGQAPSLEDLRAFAKAYLEELDRGEHGSMSRTARRVNVSRTTAYRWREACRDRGLLPREEEA